MRIAHTWARVEDGEFNEQSAKIGQHVAVIYSDRDCVRWSMLVDPGSPGGDDVHDLDATNEFDARREAEKHVECWCN